MLQITGLKHIFFSNNFLSNSCEFEILANNSFPVALQCKSQNHDSMRHLGCDFVVFPRRQTDKIFVIPLKEGKNSSLFQYQSDILYIGCRKFIIDEAQKDFAFVMSLSLRGS